MLFLLLLLTLHCGFTTVKKTGRYVRSQAGLKDRQLEVGARRPPTCTYISIVLYIWARARNTSFQCWLQMVIAGGALHEVCAFNIDACTENRQFFAKFLKKNCCFCFHPNEPRRASLWQKLCNWGNLWNQRKVGRRDFNTKRWLDCNMGFERCFRDFFYQ